MSTPELERIDAAFAAGESAKAISLLRQYFLGNPAMQTARQVHERIDRNLAALGLKPCRAFFLRSFTVEPAFPLLRAWARLHGLDLSVDVGEFNAYPQELLDPSSALYAAKPDVVFLAVQTRDLLPELATQGANLSGEALARAVEAALANLRNWLGLFRSRSNASVVILDLALPTWPSTGLLDAQAADGHTQQLQSLNRELRRLAASQVGVYVLPFEALVSRIGRDQFYDERKWLVARMPIAAPALWPFARECVRLLLPITGKVCKALVVDLDNTLWGGVVGEDGPTGIKLDAEYPGAAFQALQRAVLDLYERGILIAIASKNNPADAMEVIERHPGMLLRPKHFSAMQIAWHEKAESLKRIAAELNIGIDSLAFIDDNPVEREHVRLQAPEVYVIDLPEDPMGYAATLRQAPVFERLVLTQEDRERGNLYAQDRARAALDQSSGSVEEFLQSLEMIVAIAEPTPHTVARISQLTQKTNQFNLTTRRYDQPQVADMAAQPGTRVYSCNVVDKFGDNGLVGVVILRCEAAAWEIDTFLLSCRVIGRTVETALLSYIAAQARKAGAQRLKGWFIPTKKNAPAKDFYSSHGFAVTAEDGASQLWELDLGTHPVACPTWIRLTTPGDNA